MQLNTNYPFQRMEFPNSNTGSQSGAYNNNIVMTPYNPYSMMAMPMYLSSPGVPPNVIPFGGESRNTEESIYEFLNQVMYLDSFKKARTDIEKIEIVGGYLKDRARTWYQEQDWNTDSVFGSETLEGSFVQLLVSKFLTGSLRYHLRIEFLRRMQRPDEDSANYVKEKLKLFKRFDKITPATENLLVADLVQGLTLYSQRGLRSAPSSLEDLEAQLHQAEWIAKEELKQNIPSLMQLINNQSNNGILGTPMLPSVVTNIQQLSPSGIMANGMIYSPQNPPAHPFHLNGNSSNSLDNMSLVQLNVYHQQLLQQHLSANSNLGHIHNVTTTKSQEEMIREMVAEQVKGLTNDSNFRTNNRPPTGNNGNRVNSDSKMPNNSTLNPSEANNSGFTRKTCYNCQETGHVQYNCSKPCGLCGDESYSASGCRKVKRSMNNRNQDFPSGHRQ